MKPTIEQQLRALGTAIDDQIEREMFRLLASDAGGTPAALVGHWSGDFDVQAVPNGNDAPLEMSALLAVGYLIDRIITASRRGEISMGALLEALRLELLAGRLPQWRELRGIATSIQANETEPLSPEQ